jgi:hypothetical protein
VTTLINRLFDLMRDWHPVPQFITLIFLSLIAFGTIITLWRYCVILVHGWPPAGTPDAEVWETAADREDRGGDPSQTPRP